MAMTRWDPFQNALSLRQAFNRLLENSVVRLPRTAERTMGGMAIDVVVRDDEIEVTASLPGVKPEDVSITLADNVLTICGEVKREDAGRGDRYQRRERYYGAFERTVTLPAPVQADKAEASYEDGVLTVTLPKAPAARPAHIPIYRHRRRQMPAAESQPAQAQPASETPAGTATADGATQPAESATR